jgi:hypothetical protein
LCTQPRLWITQPQNNPSKAKPFYQGPQKGQNIPSQIQGSITVRTIENREITKLKALTRRKIKTKKINSLATLATYLDKPPKHRNIPANPKSCREAKKQIKSVRQEKIAKAVPTTC